MSTHSPLGGSVAKRFINCPGSVNLIKRLNLPETSSPFAQVGTACHEVQAQCLSYGGDPWEYTGETVEGVEITPELVTAVTRVVDECRSYQQPGSTVYVEAKLSATELHPDFYGTVDFGVVNDASAVVEDSKYGEGVIVEVEGNEQAMYYAFLLLQKHPEVRDVTLVVAQPSAFHVDGPIREWQTTAEHIKTWAREVLVPAMYATETATETRPGSWCQFCKAKLVCPSLNSLWGAAATCDPKQAILLDELALGMNLKLAKGVRQYLKALEDEVDRRLNAGLKVPGTKLVRKKANRVWKPQAEAYIIAFAGDAAMTRPELKSPAEIEKLPGAKLVVNKWAFTPDTGLTVALEDDPRVAVTVPTLEESFGAAVAQLDEG